MIEKTVDENKKITYVTVEWGADFSELLGVLRKFIDDNNTEHLLLDFSKFSYQNFGISLYGGCFELA